MKADNISEKKLFGRVLEVIDIDSALRDEMFALMHKFYFAEKTAFIRDLSAKTNVVLLEDQNGKLQGFTSVTIFHLEVEKRLVKILFSGDTIVHPDFWGSLELPRVWGKFMYETLQNCVDIPLYWFLISSGYKTYRFLPTYFNDFYPRHDVDTPEEMQKILHTAATKLFEENFNAETGIIKLNHPTPMRSEVSAVSNEKMQNPHVAFFVRKNPGYISGDELACITHLHQNNFKPFVKRLLKA